MSESPTVNYAANVQALAEADFSEVADSFANAGYQVRLPVKGILQIALPNPARRRLRLLLSVGVHGDETAPIEMLAHLLHALTAAPHTLQADLMVVVGNPAAIAQDAPFTGSCRRHLEQFRNRLRPGQWRHQQLVGVEEKPDAGDDDDQPVPESDFFGSRVNHNEWG